MVDIYAGKAVSRFMGFLSFMCLLWTVVSLFTFDLLMAFYGLVASLITAYVGYRLSGGRDNPGLAQAKWQRQTEINVVSDPVASWPGKIHALFDMLEAETGGDYAAALQQLKVRNLPPAVQDVYDAAVRNPSKQTWDALKNAMLENPPGQ